MAAKAAIRAIELRKTYKQGLGWSRREALKGVSFCVPQGQIFGFLGANGAGKTTAIKIALGLQAPSAGSVELLGSPSHLPETRARIGFLPERPYFHMNLTAREFLAFHRSLYGAALEGKRRPSDRDVLKMVGLGDVGGLLLRGFSKGMLQRIGLAQALLNDPDLLVLDEPMSGLDPVGRREVRNLLLELNHAGKTVFFSSHILSDVESLCESIAFLDKGELRYDGKVEDLLKSGPRDYEIVFRLEGAERRADVAALGALRPSGKLLRLGVDGGDAARRAAQALWSMGAEVVSLGPVHRSLEEVLFGEGGGK